MESYAPESLWLLCTLLCLISKKLKVTKTLIGPSWSSWSVMILKKCQVHKNLKSLRELVQIHSIYRLKVVISTLSFTYFFRGLFNHLDWIFKLDRSMIKRLSQAEAKYACKTQCSNVGGKIVKVWIHSKWFLFSDFTEAISPFKNR